MKRLLLAIAIVGLFTPACGGKEDPVSPEGEIAGSYSLSTINNQPLPYALQVIGTTYKVEYLSDVITIKSDGTFTDEYIIRETNAGVVTLHPGSLTGTFTRVGIALTLKWSDGYQVISQCQNDSFAFPNGGGFSFKFVRR
jgi:hypothetical protein